MRNFLIVDDNEAFAENLAEIIRDSGDTVTVASSGAVAVELARHTRFDALLSDMRMPEMGGAELVHRVRRVDPGLPAVVITAYTHDDDLQAVRNEGLLAVLPKPVPVERLLELLASARRDGILALIEDDLGLADNLSELLCLRGYGAITATSVGETERLGEIRPFAALVDLRIPGGPDGEAMRRLEQKFPGIPMLVISAHTDGRPSPVPQDRMFAKPFSTEALLRAIDGLHAQSVATVHGGGGPA